MSTLARKENTNEVPSDGIVAISAEENTPRAESVVESVVGSRACSLCGLTFPTVEEQRGHTKSDLHGYNLKQRIRGVKPVSEAEFEKLVGGTEFLPFRPNCTNFVQIWMKAYQAPSRLNLKMMRLVLLEKKQH